MRHLCVPWQRLLAVLGFVLPATIRAEGDVAACIADLRSEIRNVARREAAEGLGRRERRQELPDAQRSEDLLLVQLREDIAKLERMQPPGAVARREREIADQVLAKRTEQALIAARLSPPSCTVKELGERPTDPAKAKT